MKNFNICGVYWKIRFLGRLTKNQYRAGDCLKTGVCKFKGGLGKKEGGVFEGVDTPMYTMKMVKRT